MSRVEKPNPVNPGNSAAVSGGLTRSRASETVEVLVKINEHNGT